MSLADLVPAILLTRKEAPKEQTESGYAARARRWRAKNRDRLREYKRQWVAMRRAKGLPV